MDSKVIAKTTKEGSQISYPYIFEAKAGKLWITSMSGGLGIKLSEKDYIEDERIEYVGKALIKPLTGY